MEILVEMNRNMQYMRWERLWKSLEHREHHDGYGHLWKYFVVKGYQTNSIDDTFPVTCEIVGNTATIVDIHGRCFPTSAPGGRIYVSTELAAAHRVHGRLHSALGEEGRSETADRSFTLRYSNMAIEKSPNQK